MVDSTQAGYTRNLGSYDNVATDALGIIQDRCIGSKQQKRFNCRKQRLIASVSLCIYKSETNVLMAKQHPTGVKKEVRLLVIKDALHCEKLQLNIYVAPERNSH